MRESYSLVLVGGLIGAPAIAGTLDLSVQLPQLNVAEYHRPYVAVWLEREDRSVAANLAVWYQQERQRMAGPGGNAAGAGGPSGAAPGGGPGGGGPQMGGESGTKWLPDLRQWWRRTGRDLTVPADGITGATRPAGEQHLHFAEGTAPLTALAPGRYRLVIEAAREDGGREVLDLPFEWPVKSAQDLQAQGSSELGAVKLSLKR
ncbi:MAG: DUF2271 domain-containing protein [Steroidobacteraceae bacterium]